MLDKGQPKAHLTFDGHLLHQVKEYGGLADKADDPIELEHQEWIRQKERTWRLKEFSKRELAQLKGMRRSRHPAVRRKMTEVHKKRTARTKKKRADCTKDREHEAERARRAVFEAVVAGN